MAKRHRQEDKSFNLIEYIKTHQEQMIKGFWVVSVLLCLLLGYAHGYPIVAEGQVGYGIMIGLAWGGGAFLAILITIYLNRKLKGW